MKKRKKIRPATLMFSILFSVVCVGITFSALHTMTLALVAGKLLLPMGRLMLFIAIGLVAGQVVERFGWTNKIAILVRPFFSFSHLGNRCGAAFTTAFISGAAANAMLLEFYEDQKISRTQLFLTNYMNQFPAYFLHLPTTVFIVLPLTGKAGGLYFLITFIATLLRTLCFMTAGHLLLPRLADQSTQHSDDSDAPTTGHQKQKPSFFQHLKQTLPDRILRIFIWVLPIYTLVFVADQGGFFNYLNQTIAQHVSLSIMPIESFSVIILSFAAEFTSGFAAAGALMGAGVISVKQTVIALLAGNVLAFPIRAIRHQLPRYMGIFSPRTGLQLLLSGQLFRVLSILFTGFIYYMVA